mmetsp:Transcript_3030/g.5423  ORF Transcript_3030/g.5423 Transcript_3030/m.5423 type:complete len:82 (-) Transcript_3030:665-910(-)
MSSNSKLDHAAMNSVFENEDLMWIMVSYITGFRTSRRREANIEQYPSASSDPILPLLVTFRSRRDGSLCLIDGLSLQIIVV